MSLGDSFDDFENLHTRFAETLAERAKKAFEVSGYPDAWKPSEAAEREGRKTLIDTERLMHSFELDDPENFFETSGESMAYGSNVDYGKYHYDDDFATELREIIVFDDELNEELSNDIVDWMEEIL